ncbi:MAG: hypothetical protein V2I33_08690 [Kangiellaceae bacterium]|nr:hypothetical protein [Kangiellaceae bacterium]
MTRKIIKLGSIKLIGLTVLSLLLLSGCGVHSRVGHGYHGHHHSTVFIHGGRGRASTVIGAMVAGAVISSAISEHNRDRDRDRNDNSSKSQQSVPDKDFYLKTLEGDCYWVSKDKSGNQTRKQVEAKFCD